jgi:hypothetical protein
LGRKVYLQRLVFLWVLIDNGEDIPAVMGKDVTNKGEKNIFAFNATTWTDPVPNNQRQENVQGKRIKGQKGMSESPKTKMGLGNLRSTRPHSGGSFTGLSLAKMRKLKVQRRRC